MMYGRLTTIGLAIGLSIGMAGRAAAWHGCGWGGHRGWGWSVGAYPTYVGWPTGFSTYSISYNWGWPGIGYRYSNCLPTYRASCFRPAWHTCFAPRPVYVYRPVCAFEAYSPTYYVAPRPIVPVNCAWTGGLVAPGNNVGWTSPWLLTATGAAQRRASDTQATGVNSTEFAENLLAGSPSFFKLTSTATTATGQAAATEVPAELLAAADAIFSTGGYRQAAAAYARLAVRYGVNDLLSTRRFVALTASGDCEQAAVVVESSMVTGAKISAYNLPSNMLRALYGERAWEVDSHCELLAKYALQRIDDRVALTMIGTWLQLDQQAERGQLFLDRASSLMQTDLQVVADSRKLASQLK